MNSHNYLLTDETISKNHKRSLYVVILTTLMMVIEIAAGLLTGSMALLADGWHMATHAGAIGISVIAYHLARSEKMSAHFSFGAGKFIPLGGYTSALILAFMAIIMMIESTNRLMNPVSIQYGEAILVAVVGLVVNLASVFLLFDDHHHHHHDHSDGHTHAHVHDHNLKSAYMHVVADSFTSLLAIGALLLGKYYDLAWTDPLMGVVGGVVILRWGWLLMKETAYELLDGHAKGINKEKIIRFLRTKDVEVVDIHLWRIAPSAHACEIIVESKMIRGSDFYHKHLKSEFPLTHLIVEERAKGVIHGVFRSPHS